MTPVQEEMCLIIQKSAVDYFGVPFPELITKSRERKEVERRYMLFYLLEKTGLTGEDLAAALKVPRKTIEVGQKYILDKMPIYPHILASLTAIIEISDTFTKKYVWHIPKPNTTLLRPQLPQAREKSIMRINE